MAGINKGKKRSKEMSSPFDKPTQVKSGVITLTSPAAGECDKERFTSNARADPGESFLDWSPGGDDSPELFLEAGRPKRLTSGDDFGRLVAAAEMC
jgi:hypothetical protein